MNPEPGTTHAPTHAPPPRQNPMHQFPTRPSPSSRANRESAFSRIHPMNPEPGTARAPTHAPPPRHNPMHQSASPTRTPLPDRIPRRPATTPTNPLCTVARWYPDPSSLWTTCTSLRHRKHRRSLQPGGTRFQCRQRTSFGCRLTAAAQPPHPHPSPSPAHPYPAPPAKNPIQRFAEIHPMNPGTSRNPNSTFSRIYPMNPEPGAPFDPTPTPGRCPTTASPPVTRPRAPLPSATRQKPNSTFCRIHPMNPGTSRNPNSTFSRIYPMNPEPGAPLDPTPTPGRCPTTASPPVTRPRAPLPSATRQKPNSTFCRIHPMNPGTRRSARSDHPPRRRSTTVVSPTCPGSAADARRAYWRCLPPGWQPSARWPRVHAPAGTHAQTTQNASPRFNPMNRGTGLRPTEPNDNPSKRPMHPGTAARRASPAVAAAVSPPVTGLRANRTLAQSAQIAIPRINPMNPDTALRPTGPDDSATKRRMHPGTVVRPVRPAAMAPTRPSVAGRAPSSTWKSLRKRSIVGSARGWHCRIGTAMELTAGSGLA